MAKYTDGFTYRAFTDNSFLSADDLNNLQKTIAENVNIACQSVAKETKEGYLPIEKNIAEGLFVPTMERISDTETAVSKIPISADVGEETIPMRFADGSLKALFPTTPSDDDIVNYKALVDYVSKNGGGDISGAVLLNPTEQEQTINSDIHILGRLLVDKGIECKDYLVIDSPSYRNQSYIVFPTGDKYFGADTYVQDAFAIAIDKPTRTMRIGVGMIYYDETGKKRSSFAFGWTISGSSEDEAVATREDKITDGNIPQWDATNNMFIDSGVSLGDISAALDELHAYAQALVTGGAAV